MQNDDLRAWRQRQGWTQRQAAAELGISLAAYQNYEHGLRHVTGHAPRPVRVPRPIALACRLLDERRQNAGRLRRARHDAAAAPAPSPAS